MNRMVVAALCGVFAFPASAQQDYPAKTVRIIVPFAPGGSTDIFARLTDEDLQRRCQTPGQAPITTWKWLRLMVEHEIHHRGQMYLYLAMLGVETPPLYGLTSEQVRARSVGK